jgi:hypothetical protein
MNVKDMCADHDLCRFLKVTLSEMARGNQNCRASPIADDEYRGREIIHCAQA